jgi:hypothetical protein
MWVSHISRSNPHWQAKSREVRGQPRFTDAQVSQRPQEDGFQRRHSALPESPFCGVFAENLPATSNKVRLRQNFVRTKDARIVGIYIACDRSLRVPFWQAVAREYSKGSGVEAKKRA